MVLKPGVVKFLYPGVLHPGVKNSLTTRDLRSRGCKILISWGPRSRGLRSEGTKWSYNQGLTSGGKNSLTTRGFRSRDCKILISLGLTSRDKK